MLTKIESQDNNKVNLTFEVSKEDFEKMIYEVYLETKENYPIIGIQNGKAPKCLIEEQYGESVFYENTVNNIIDKEFELMNKKYKTRKLKRENVENINLLQIGNDKDLIFELLVNY